MKYVEFYTRLSSQYLINKNVYWIGKFLIISIFGGEEYMQNGGRKSRFFWLMSEKRDILRNAIGFVAVKEIRIK